jgi:molybdenum cofactor guanylyltransferase
MEKHQKHSKITKPDIGNFGRNEWAIMGTNCGNIQKLAQELVKNIPSNYKTAYVDADHKAADEATPLPYFLEYTDKIQFNRFDFNGKISSFQYKSLFNETDIILVNGNHFEAKRQVVVLDEKKFESLSRKLNRLTQVEAFILPPNFPSLQDLESLIPDFLKNHLPNWGGIPVFNVNETDKITNHLISNLTIPKINALILAGGKSTRMGQDKALINYQGQPQWQFLSGILSRQVGMTMEASRGVNSEVFISCQEEQAHHFQGENLIFDSFTGLGPMGAILSAFRENPNTAWLVVACDLPLLDENTLKFLIENRDTSKIATTFRSPESKEGFPEPLITIWEPKSYAVLLQFLAQGISCPRKVLINSDVQLLDAPLPVTLMNANTPDDKKVALTLLGAAVTT